MDTHVLFLLMFAESMYMYHSEPEIIAQNHYLGCHGIDILVHKVFRYTPSHECWEVCERKGLQTVSVVGARWCGCGQNGEMIPASPDCKSRCYFIPQHKCQCYDGTDDEYDEVALSRAMDFMEALPKPNKLPGYNCRDVLLLNYFYQFPKPVKVRQKECHDLCAKVPRHYRALLMPYKCGCAKNFDPDSDPLRPVTKECVDEMICIELKTSVCLCGDTTLDPNTYADEANVGPLLDSDKFRCFFTRTYGRPLLTFREPGVQVKLHTATRPEDCILTCAKLHFKLAAIHWGGKCTCHNEMVSEYFPASDCQYTCLADNLQRGCGSKYTAAVYSTVGGSQGTVTVDELEDLLQQKMHSETKLSDSNTGVSEHEGCYGVDLLVHKVDNYGPSADCWERCKLLGARSVAVAGGRWCGCPKNGPLGAGDPDCFIYCAFISHPKCECFHGDENSYQTMVEELVDTFISELPSPHDFAGYNCSVLKTLHHKNIYPKEAEERAQECFKETCKLKNRQLGAYLMGYKCGCKLSDDPNDDTLSPVTQECVSRMICIEVATSACLCGNEKVDPLSYQPMTRSGPLLKTDRFECLSMEQQNTRARKLRRTEFQDIWKSSITPEECIKTCSEADYDYAGISLGGICGCQHYPGLRKFSQDDCSMPCTVEGVTDVCGGPYTASVFPTDSRTGQSVEQLVEDLEKDAEASLEIIPHVTGGSVISEEVEGDVSLPEDEDHQGNESRVVYEYDQGNESSAVGSVMGTTEEDFQNEALYNDMDKQREMQLAGFIFAGVFLGVFTIMSVCIFLKRRPSLENRRELGESLERLNVDHEDEEDEDGVSKVYGF